MAVKEHLTLEKTKIFKRLKECEVQDNELAQNVLDVVNELTPLLNETRRCLFKFTLHDVSHSLSVIEIMGNIIPDETFEQLNIMELSILIFAAFLHDTGMICSKDDMKSIMDTPEFKKFSNQYDDEDDEKIFHRYLRLHHGERSEDFVKNNNLKNRILFDSQMKAVALLCKGHTLPLKELTEKTFPVDRLINHFKCNLHYLVRILRLADYLDIFPNRAPRVLYDFINPKDAESIEQWEKHLSVEGWDFNSNKIRISAECTNPDYERAVRETIKGINAEKEDAYRQIKKYNEELSKIYKFNIEEDISLDEIKSDGSYRYADLKFDIDYKSVINLLMGEKLYSSPEVALRELLQNSIDAINFRKRVEKNDDLKAKIKIEFDDKKLSISDNGIGMDIEILENYFLKVGKSFYRSKDGKALVRNYESISEFGIGILSCFMVADSIQVESKKLPEDFNKPYEPVLVDMPTAYGYMILRDSNRQEIGTKITLNLKEKHPFKNIPALIRKIAPFIEYDIEYVENGKSINISPFKDYDEIIKDEINPIKCDEILKIDLSNSDNKELEGVEGTIHFVEYKKGYERHNFYRNDKIINSFYQEGFYVSSYVYDIFLSEFDAISVLNFKNKAKLQLSPNRNEFVMNKKSCSLFSLVRNEIYKIVIQFLQDAKQNNSFEEYLKIMNRFIKCLKMYRIHEINEKLLDYIYYKCMDMSGETVYKTLTELTNYDKVFLKDDYEIEDTDYQKVRENINTLFVNEKCIFVLQENQWVLDCLRKLNLKGVYVAYDKSKFKIYSKLFKASNMINKRFINKPIDFCRELYTFNNKTCLFFDDLIHCTFNKSHPYFKAIFDKGMPENEVTWCECFKPLIKQEYSFLRENYKNVFSEVWENLKNYKVLDENDVMPELTEEDVL